MADEKSHYQSEFGDRLKKLRRQKNLSQQEVADKIGMHFTNISRYERGLARPNSETLKKLAEILSVSSGYLIEGTLEDGVQAHFEDRELLLQFQQVQELPDEDKATVKKLLDAFLFQKKVQNLSAG
jgi:transcriptional regulator with XRE-family HTH domain